MNKMKHYLLHSCRRAALAALFVLLAVSVASCGSDHAKILPADCPGVVKIDVKSLLEKSQLDERSEVKDWKEKALDYADEHFSSSTHKRLKEMFDDPAEFGVDLREAVYVYAPSKSFKYAGFVAKVLDEDDLYEFLEMMRDENKDMGKLKEYDNCRMLVSDNGRAALAFDDDILIFAASVDDEARVARDLSRRFDEMGDESILDNPAFAEMDARDGDVTAYLSYGDLFKVMPEYMTKELKQMTKGTGIDGFALLAGLNFGDETVEAWAEGCPLTDEARAQMEKYAGMQREVSGKYLAKLPKETFLVAGFGVEGAKWWSEITKQSVVKEALQKEPEMAKMFGDICKAVEGEGVFAMGLPESDDAHEPLMTAFVDLKSNAAVEKLLSQMAGGNVSTDVSDSVAYGDTEVYADSVVAEPDYYGYGYYDYDPYVSEPAFSKDPATGRYRYCFNTYHSADTPARYAVLGTTKSLFYFSNQSGFDPKASASPSLAGADYAERIKGKVAYGVIDFRTLFGNSEVRKEIDRSPFADYADHLSTLEMYADKDMKGSMVLYLKDLGKNATPLSLLVDMIADLADKNL